MSVVLARTLGERTALDSQADGNATDVKSIVRKLGLRLIEADLGPEVSGLLVTRPGDVCIVVNEGDREVRQRFTIAHELGHHLLRHQTVSGEHVHVDRGNLISQRGPRASLGIDPKEVEANQFAAALLMPSLRLKKAASKFSSPLFDVHVEQLALQFNVSEQAMTIRLTALRLL